MTIWNRELIATSTAASSRLPQARSFQMRTMAMQRASPTMMSPVRQLGQVGEEHPREGEHQQRTDQPVEDQREARGCAGRRARRRRGVADLGQHRVHHRQQADRDRQRDRVDLDPLEAVVQVRDQPAPAARPATMARPIHTGRNRSRVDSRAATEPTSVAAGSSRRRVRHDASMPRGVSSTRTPAVAARPRATGSAAAGAQQLASPSPTARGPVSWSASPVLTYHSHRAPSGSVTQVSTLVA